MKWQLRKKLSPSSSSTTSNALPISWVSKFKLKSKRDIPIPPVKAQHYPHMPLPLPLGGGDVTVDTTIKCQDAQPLSVGNDTHQRMITRKSVYIGGGTQQQISMERPSKPASKFRPRTPSTRETTFKIKALEEHKKKKKKKKNEKQESPSQLQQVTAAWMESFAVVKHSQDPQHDFRDSMMEMIMDKGITKPEEMEELLACYLTLNADDYHHLIIKVFRQVWHELDDMRTFNTQLQHLNI